MAERQKTADFEKQIEKLRRYCAYRERCGSEIRLKMYELNLAPDLYDRVFEILKSENFYNEERFAHAYVRGKLRINAWGKLKIKAGLRSKGIDGELIRKAIGEISAEEYHAVLLRLLESKGEHVALIHGFSSDEIAQVQE